MNSNCGSGKVLCLGNLLSEYAPSGGGTLYPAFDAQQNAVAAADDTCDARRYRYTAFGNLAAGTDASWCDLTADQWGVMDADGWDRFAVCDAPSNQTFGGQQHYYRDPETELYLLGAGTSGGGRYYDPATGRFLARDPIGFAGGDVNLYRYAGNNPVNSVDPSGRQAERTHLPADYRGAWVEGTKGNGVFKYNDIPINRDRGIVGMEVRYKDNNIDIGAFPSEVYYGGNAEAASVDLDVEITGTTADNTAADAKMRERNPDWRRPRGYTWNHAGSPGSKRMELVKENVHAAVHPQGSASAPRAARRGSRACYGLSPTNGAALASIRQPKANRCSPASVSGRRS